MNNIVREINVIKLFDREKLLIVARQRDAANEVFTR